MRASFGDRIKVLNMQIRLSVAAVGAMKTKRIKMSNYVFWGQMLNGIALNLRFSCF